MRDRAKHNNMIKSSSPHLFLLAIACTLLFLCTIVHCNNNDDQIGTTLFRKRLTTKTTIDHLYDLLNQGKLNDEDLGVFIRDVVRPYPDRRSSFHAMRGKRRLILQ